MRPARFSNLFFPNKPIIGLILLVKEVAKIEQDWSGKLNRKNERSTDGLCIVQREITNKLGSCFPVKMTKFKLNNPPRNFTYLSVLLTATPNFLRILNLQFQNSILS